LFTSLPQVCDLIQKEVPSASNLQQVVRYICKRVKNPDERVALNALVLLETTVKNGKPVYYKAVAETGIPKLLKVVYNPLTSQAVRDRILQLFDIWADAFQPVESYMPQFKEAYQELLKRGFNFPRRTEDCVVPVIHIEEDPELAATLASSRAETSNSEADADRSIPSLQYSPSSSDNDGRELEKLREELKETNGIVKLFEETVSFIKPETEDPSEVELARELYEKVTTLHQRLSSLLENVSDEDIINKCLTLNDFMLQVLAEYESKVSIYQSIVDGARASSSVGSQNLSSDVSGAPNSVSGNEENVPKSAPAWLKASVPASSAGLLKNHENVSHDSLESKSATGEKNAVMDNNRKQSRDNQETFSPSNEKKDNNSSSNIEDSHLDNEDLIGLSSEKNAEPLEDEKQTKSVPSNQTLGDPFDELFASTLTNHNSSSGSKGVTDSFADLLIEDK